jgi:hypothetical protein
MAHVAILHHTGCIDDGVEPEDDITGAAATYLAAKLKALLHK